MSTPSTPRPLYIGCAAGFSGDRTDAAGPVVDTLIGLEGDAFLIFETLAERTLAFAQLARKRDPDAGYEPLLDDMLRPVLQRCLEHGIRIVSNFGAANPRGAARHILRMAQELGLPPPRVAVVEGDDVVGEAQRPLLLASLSADESSQPIVAANAYQGAEGIVAALRAGAQIVVAGRVADPSLAVGPIVAHYGWSWDDWSRLGKAVVVGHLLECGAQVTGGYYADPGYKDVPDLDNVGYPIAQVMDSGDCIIFKSQGTGGCVNEHTVKEQILYEMHDPAAYVSPDAVADITQLVVKEIGPDRVQVTGATGHPRPDNLKVNVYYDGGWLAEGEISYSGVRAEARARMAGEILRKRLSQLHLRIDLIGVVSVFADDDGRLLSTLADAGARDVRLRVAANHDDPLQAEQLVREVNALYTCGPAGGGGVRAGVRKRLSMKSCFIPRASAPATYQLIAQEV